MRGLGVFSRREHHVDQADAQDGAESDPLFRVPDAGERAWQYAEIEPLALGLAHDPPGARPIFRTTRIGEEAYRPAEKFVRR